MKASGLVKGILKYCVGFGLLVYVIYRSWDDKPKDDGTTLPGLNTILKQSPDWLVAPVILALLITVISTQFYRWYLLVRAVDLPFTKRNAFRLGLVGYFYNIFLPGAIGGDFVKAYFIAKDHPTRMPVAVATVIIDRLLGLFGLLLITTLVGGGLWLSDDPRIVGNEYLRSIVRGASIMTGSIVLFWVFLGILPERRKLRFEERLHHLKPRKLGQTLAELWFALRTYRQRSKIIYISVGLSAIGHACMVLLMFFCVRFFPLPDPASLAETAVIAPIGYIAQVFFPVPGGVGGAEAIFGFLYTLLKHPEQTGVIGRLTLRLFEWSIGLAGYIMFLNMRKELAVPEPKV